MDRTRLLTLARNLCNYKFGYFIRFQHSSILKNNLSLAFCKLPLEENNGKTQVTLSSSSQFCTFRQIPNDFAVLNKWRGKADFSTKILSTRREHSDKFETLGIETIQYLLGRQKNLLTIRIRHDKNNGNKWIHLSQKNPFANSDYPNIPIKDAYLLIRRIDSLLMNKFAAHKHPFCEIFIKGGHYYDYRLEIFQDKICDLLEFTLETIVKRSHRRVPSKSFPIRVLPLLRDGMAKLLVEFDGSQSIGLLSKLPKWMWEKDVNIKTITGDANNLQKQESLFYRDSLNYKVDDEPQERKIRIEYVRSIRGREYIQINQRFDKQKKIYKDDKSDPYQYADFEHIPFEDVPHLLNALRAMSNDLQKKPPIGRNQSSMICPQIVKGIYYDYKLEFHTRKNQQLNFSMQTILTNRLRGHAPKKLYDQIPIDVFNWLKEQMAEILLLISTSSHKLGLTNDAAEKQGTVSDLFESSAARIEILHEEKLEYLDSLNETNIVLIQINQSNNKRKWIFLITRLFFTDHKMAKIFVPEDAYSVINVMDELMSKIIEQDKPPNCPIFVRDNKGLLYDYKLGIRLNQNGLLEFTIASIATAADPKHLPKIVFMPIQLLPSLRNVMAKMLTEFDGTQQIGPAPSPLPKWMFEENSYQQQQNFMTMEEANKEQLETIRQEKLDFIVNTFDEKFNRQIIIQLQRNKRGEEFIQILQKFDKLESSEDIEEDSNKLLFPPIPIIDAYRLPDAMQALSNDLEEKYPNHRIPDDIPPKTSICRQIIRGGLCYDYRLEIDISPSNNQLNFGLQTITTGANKLHRPRILYGPTPLHVFNWLKEKIIALLKSSSNQQEQKICQNEPKRMEFKEGKEDWNNLKNSLLISVNGRGQKIAYKCNKICKGLIRREAEYYNVEGELYDRMIKIEFKQGKSDTKYIIIVQRFIGEDNVPYFIDFTNIPLPEDASRFLNAMLAMSNELEEKRHTLFIGENKSSLICQQLVRGHKYDYKMELHSLQNQQLDFRLKAMPNKAYHWFDPKELVGPIPIHMFNWLKDKMAEILEDDKNMNEKR